MRLNQGWVWFVPEAGPEKLELMLILSKIGDACITIIRCYLLNVNLISFITVNMYVETYCDLTQIEPQSFLNQHLLITTASFTSKLQLQGVQCFPAKLHPLFLLHCSAKRKDANPGQLFQVFGPHKQGATQYLPDTVGHT